LDDGDFDGDGFDNDIDCNDCVAQINPGAYDFPLNGIDEDCDGSDGIPCEEWPPSVPASPEDAARAIGLCQRARPEGREWGIIDARFTRADGIGTAAASEMQVGVLERFGAFLPRRGGSLLVLSSGIARMPDRVARALCFDHGESGGFPTVCPWNLRRAQE
jgi:hypothetical protein